jgi:hypothetical protein
MDATQDSTQITAGTLAASRRQVRCHLLLSLVYFSEDQPVILVNILEHSVP